MASIEPLRDRLGDVTRTHVQTVAVARAEALGIAVLRAMGSPPDAAERQTRQLVEGDLRGRASHGMQRLPTLVQRIANGVLDPAARPQLRWRSRTVLSVDGLHGFGPVAAWAAVEELAVAARGDGIALATIRRAGHVGMLAPYVEWLAEHGLVGLALTTSEALVHPAGGRVAMMGTNPIAVGIPASPHAFVLDMSTAAISAGDVMAHAARGAALPEGRAIDAEGLPTSDPQRALDGALSPFGGAKGYGLALAFELLVAALSATAVGTGVHGTLDVDQPSTKGDVVIAIDPAVVGPEWAAGLTARSIDAYLDELRASPPAPGGDGAVLIPGDRMRRERAARLQGGIPYPDAIWQQLVELERRADA